MATIDEIKSELSDKTMIVEVMSGFDAVEIHEHPFYGDDATLLILCNGHLYDSEQRTWVAALESWKNLTARLI